MKQNVQSVTETLVFQCLKRRKKDSHKGTYGQLLAVCGSSAYRGSAVLACGGALRSGAGIVCLASVEPVLAALMAKHSECILLPLPMNREGGIDASSTLQIAQRLSRSTALLVGCGMGMTRDTERIVCDVLQNAVCPMILDADGLNVLAAREDASALLCSAKAPLILTPHMGEMARLRRCSVEQLKADPCGAAAEYARKWGCTLVLKDAVTYIASPDGTVYVNTTGNPGLARGGSGDVLAGIIASLAAQGMTATEAAVCGVYLHGAAADDCARRLSMCGMLPSDLLEGLCNVFLRNGR